MPIWGQSTSPGPRGVSPRRITRRVMTAPDPFREEEIESRWEAAPAVATIIGFQVVLASVSRVEHWTLWTLPWWVWLISVPPELALLIPLAWNRPSHRLRPHWPRRKVFLVLPGGVSLTNRPPMTAAVRLPPKGHGNNGQPPP